MSDINSNGIMLQWGYQLKESTASYTQTNHTIIFPVAFSSGNSYSFCSQCNRDTYVHASGVNNFTATTIKVNGWYIVNERGTWIAVGY